jgi:hypothetical protein
MDLGNTSISKNAESELSIIEPSKGQNSEESKEEEKPSFSFLN